MPYSILSFPPKEPLTFFKMLETITQITDSDGFKCNSLKLNQGEETESLSLSSLVVANVSWSICFKQGFPTPQKPICFSLG